MLVGTRVVFPEDLNQWDADLVQISVYRGMRDRMGVMRQCASLCRRAGVRFVIHPVEYSFAGGREDMLSEAIEMARLADLALIIRDERDPGGGRLSGEGEEGFRRALDKLGAEAPVSVENAAHSGDIKWFWDRFGGSITLDLGHLESSGMDSVEFVRSLEPRHLDRLQFVHAHRNGELRGGITDHWPLEPGCREMEALAALLGRKGDLSVILELNETGSIGENLSLLRALRRGLEEGA